MRYLLSSKRDGRSDFLRFFFQFSENILDVEFIGPSIYFRLWSFFAPYWLFPTTFGQYYYHFATIALELTTMVSWNTVVYYKLLMLRSFQSGRLEFSQSDWDHEGLQGVSNLCHFEFGFINSCFDALKSNH